MKNYVCGICGKKYESLDYYLACVAKCGEKLKAEQKAEAEKERLEKVNAALNRIKEAKKYWEDQLDKFKEEYPEEYELNFGKKDNYDDKIIKPGKTAGLGRIGNAELTYAKNGNDKPKITAKVNGKDVSAEKLFEDPDCRYIAKLLGLV